LLKTADPAAAAAAIPSCFLGRFRGSNPPPIPMASTQATPWPEANAILGQPGQAMTACAQDELAY